MSDNHNQGFDPQVIQTYREKIAASGSTYFLDEEDEQSDEYAHFYFIGKYEDRDVIFDAVIYTLRLQHESEMYELAEDRAQKQFPQYLKITNDADGRNQLSPELEEEIGMFLAEVILELEEEEAVKVKEHVDQDIHVDFGISLDAGLNRETVSPEVIKKFIADFNGDKLDLDETLYSFQIQDQDSGNS